MASTISLVSGKNAGISILNSGEPTLKITEFIIKEVSFKNNSQSLLKSPCIKSFIDTRQLAVSKKCFVLWW
jgi:hypothetical protein